MSKTKNKPGIHLHSEIRMDSDNHWYKMYKWYIVSRNGNIVGKSWRWYKRKSGAVKSIKIAATIFCSKFVPESTGCIGAYYDHSMKDSPLKSYL